MSDWSTQRIGRYGERVAARFLRRAGFRIVAKNRHYGKNELDLIAQSKKYILFVEVKTRTFSQKPDAEQARPVMAVDEAKRKRTVAAALAHLQKHPNERAPRFDVIEVYLDRCSGMKPFKINHIENAFGRGGVIRR